MEAGVRREWRVKAGTGQVGAEFESASKPGDSVFIFAHGAGGHMADRGMLALAALFRDIGMHVARFNFPYREIASGRPDRMPVLEACIASVVSRVREELREEPGPQRLILGGRSMGGRAASMLAAKGFVCDGLLLLAYPLHPAGKPETLRDAHLAAITVPVLCFNGTRDPLCRRDLMENVVGKLGGHWTMRWLEDADHSFHVTKSSGRTDAEVLQEVAAASRSWLAGLRSR